MDLMDDELRRVLSGSVDASTDSMARELDRLRVRDRGPTATERAAASQPSFRMPSSGRRRPEQRGGGEALETLGSAIAGSVPAGLAGLAVLPFQGPEGAGKMVERVQDYLTIDPQTEGGVRALRGIAGALSPLGAPAQAVGDATLRLTGSPLAATAAEVLLDPLNATGTLAAAKPVARAAAAGARQAGKAAKTAGQTLGPKAAEMAEAYLQRAGMAPQIFIGKSAKTWDAASNARAAEMEAAGIPAQTIWRETGNWRAPDGQWRQEISDVGAKFSPDPKAQVLGDVLKHPDLFKAYPEAQSIKLREGSQAAYFPALGFGDPEIAIGRRPEKSSTLHEVTHSIQEREGFGEGSNPELFELKIKSSPEQRDAFNAFANLSEKLGGPSDLKPSDLARSGDVAGFIQDVFDQMDFNARLSAHDWNDLQQSMKKIGIETTDDDRGSLSWIADNAGNILRYETEKNSLTPYEQYMKTPGEAEARAVQARMNLTPEERRAKFPEESYDVPIGELIDAPRTGGPALLTTYHGTPHTFPAEPGLPLGRFRAEKIGSGEGAQAYGHGIYVAESPEVGKGYQSRLSSDRGFSYKGKSGLTRQEVQDLINAEVGGKFLDGVTRASGVADAVIDDLVLGYQRKPGQVPRQYKEGSERAELYRRLKGEIQHAEPGSLYTVDLPDPIVDKMLDWDRPISEQSELVQSIAKKLDTDLSLPGRALYNQAQLKADLGEGPLAPAASEWFRGQGIPGIKYLDEQSRGVTGAGKWRIDLKDGTSKEFNFKPNDDVLEMMGATATPIGTRNFVVFPGEEDKLTILQRNDEKLPTKKADGGLIGETMSYTTAADIIADKLMRQGMDPDQAFMTALRMSDARMKAGGAVLMADGGDAERELTLQARNRSLAALDRGLAPRARKTWDGPMIDRPIVNGKALVSAEELADFRRRFGEKMTLRDLLNADKGRGPSGAMPAARGAQGANVAPVQADPYQDPSRALEGAAAAQRAIAQPGRDAVEGVYPEAALLPAARLPQAARAVSRALATPKLREHPSISPERQQMLKEMEDYINGLNRGNAPAVDPKMRALEERIEPRMQAGGLPKVAAAAAARAAARAEARLAEKAAKQAAERGLSAAPSASLTQAAEEASKILGKGRDRPYVKPDTVQRMIIERAADIAKNAPKLNEQEVANRAQRQVVQRLKWERETRPEMQERYGQLARSSYDMPAPQRLQNTPEVVAERAEKARAFLEKPTEPWSPPPAEKQAFDRSLIKDALEGFPGIEQTRFPRYQAPRAQTDYINEIYEDPANRELIKQQIKRGLPLGGETFYASLYPLKMAALERGIPASRFDQFVYETAPASARNSIMNEMAVGQFLRDMKARGLPLDEDTVTAEMANFKQKYGIGLPLMPIHREGVRNVIEGGLNLRDMVKADIPTNYKIPTYGTQKAGDFGKSVVLDVHEAAGETQGSRFHPYFTEQGGFGPSEYGLAEGKMLDIAQELGIPGGMAQAGRWFGGGELTGLKSPRGDALDLLEKQAAYTMQGMGINPTPKAIRDYILNMVESGEGVLMPYFKGTPMPDVRTVKKEGGEVTSEAQGALGAAKKSRKGHGALV